MTIDAEPPVGRAGPTNAGAGAPDVPASDGAAADTRWSRGRRVGGLAGWSVVSQAASAGSNSIVELGIALFAGVEVLGAWAIRFAVVQTALYLMRAAASEPLLADPRPHDDLSREPRAGAYLTLTAVTALVLSAVVALVGVVTGIANLPLLALALPIVLLQDALRYLGFWSLRPRVAGVMDLTWLLVSGAGVAVIAARPTVGVAIAVWAAGAAASAGLGLFLVRPRARGSAIAWWRSVRQLATATTLDTVMYLASNQWLWFWVSATGGAAALGVYRLATLVANPAMLLFLGAQTLIIPVISRRGHLPRWGLGLLVALPVVGLATTAVLGLALAESRSLFDVSADQLTVGLWAATGAYVLAGGVAGPMAAVMRGYRRGGRLVASRAASVVVTIALAVTFVPEWETTGLLLAQAVGMGVFSAACVGTLLRPTRRGAAA